MGGGAQTAAIGRPDWAGAARHHIWLEPGYLGPRHCLAWDDALYAWSPLGEDCRDGSAGDGIGSNNAGNGPDRVDTGGKVLRGGPSPSESANGGSRGEGPPISLLQYNKTMNPSPPTRAPRLSCNS
ncbi:predicted protein [Chaetomium globosum CBS 148.51]|uniref:Uncharacterized protein n=1 Tax=Chaetomium globosum (strain ATCC 6205 / CBS 148.51 / DSM 1962 / NBRC 6347 / NRRL 1970) TaxID=306901 RepID=Q2HHS8_CHAGB|nr:uncharacterized protein CHGG_00226 [Chaetomium globosum CBS 148.51]EAQ91991.1 predicted protein [Chaetomium globosum CBS 148.51]